MDSKKGIALPLIALISTVLLVTACSEEAVITESQSSQPMAEVIEPVYLNTMSSNVNTSASYEQKISQAWV